MRAWGLAVLLSVFAPAAFAQDASPRPATHHRHKPARHEAEAAALPAEESEHVVEPGETLGGIAARAHVPRILIAEANGLTRPYRVHTGQRLELPRTRHHRVREGETGFDIAYRYGVPFSAIAVANGLKPHADLEPGQDLLIPTLIEGDKAAAPEDADHESAEAPPAHARRVSESEAADDSEAHHPAFIWPLAGKVRRGFRTRDEANYHDGIDIAADSGAAVRAAAAGTVIFAGKEPRDFGKLVVIDHGRSGGHDWQSAYGFLGRITVHKGDAIKRRERLGTVGHTGKAKSDELHFEIRKDNRPVDPVGELPERG